MKKGKPAKSDQNEPLIVDEQNKAYKVNDTVLGIWNQCDGNRTVEQIIDELVKVSGADKRKISDDVHKVIMNLEHFKLLEKV